MRRSTFALWSTALFIGASVTAATGQEPKLPEFYEAHEIGYIDLNSPQSLAGWLSTIPAGSPMASMVQRNDGTNDVSNRAPTRFNPMDGRASAPGTAPNVAGTPVVGTPRGGGDAGGSVTGDGQMGRRTVPTSPDTQGDAGTNGDTTPDPRIGGFGNDAIVRDPVTGEMRGSDPLIHFYADSAVTVNVKAGFAQGIPMAWWPRGLATGERVEFRDVRVDPRLNPATSRTLDLQKWPGLKPLGLLRDATATPVKLGNAVEGGIAYEGILRFGPRLTVRMARTGIYEVRNDSTMDLVNAILIPFGEQQRGIALGTVTPGDVVYVDLQDATLQSLEDLMALQLAKSGLFPGEIASLQKLLLTPEFRLNPGARLLAQFADDEWAARFPLEIAPAPKRLVRVGMLRIFDAQLYNAAADRQGNGRPAPKTQLTGTGGG